MPQLVRSAVLRRLFTVCRIVPALWLFVLANAGLGLLLTPAIAAGAGIDLELNSTKTVAGACEVSFVVRNGLSHSLDRFQLDLYVFDDSGAIKSRSNIDLPPLRNSKITVLTFRLHAAPCEAISKILVNNIPLCRAETGTLLDCLSGLSVSSRDDIRLVK